MIVTLKSYFKLEIFVLHGVFLLICLTKKLLFSQKKKKKKKKKNGNTEIQFGKEALGN